MVPEDSARNRRRVRDLRHLPPRAAAAPPGPAFSGCGDHRDVPESSHRDHRGTTEGTFLKPQPPISAVPASQNPVVASGASLCSSPGRGREALHGACSSGARPRPGSAMRSWLLLLAVLSAPLARADELERSIAVEPGERLRIELARGDVDVFTHDAAEVRIEARARGLGASGVEFQLTREPGEIVLRSRGQRRLEW